MGGFSRRRIGKLTACFVAVCGGGVCVAQCYEIGVTRTCCGTQSTICNGDGIWFCSSTTNTGPFTIQFVKQADYMDPGYTSYTLSIVGTCTRTPVSCGMFNGECIPGTPAPEICTSDVLSGQACSGGPAS